MATRVPTSTCWMVIAGGFRLPSARKSQDIPGCYGSSWSSYANRRGQNVLARPFPLENKSRGVRFGLASLTGLGFPARLS